MRETKQTLRKIILDAYEKAPQKEYHNWNHILDVVTTVKQLGKSEGVGSKILYIAEISAYYHDVIHHNSPDDEKLSADYAYKKVQQYGLTEPEAMLIGNTIKATNVKTQPNNILERIIRDADVANFGRKDFMEKNELVRLELNFEKDLNWYQNTLKLLEGHQFYTQSARQLYTEGLKKNIHKVEKKLEVFSKCDRKESYLLQAGHSQASAT